MGIYSVVIHSRPENLQSVTDKLTAIEGVEVHATSDKGKLVVSLEHPDRGYCSDTLMGFHNIPGVLNSTLIYEYSGDDIDTELQTPGVAKTKQPKEERTIQ